ncbi:hypothetical protein EG329_006499 [Mollisiaceae sp. DMI_Dod_QoI]|nr:hypothetical protein EG329_006499 [Helotiales sp. DMI_Dod_QoI]
MDYQPFTDPNMLNETNIEPEANELSFDPEKFINPYTFPETWTNEDSFEWGPHPEESFDMALWGDLSLTAAQPDLFPMTSSSLSNVYVPFEDFEQLFYSSSGSQPPDLSPGNSSESFLLDGLSSSTPETISDKQGSESQSPQPRPSSSSRVYKCSFCAKTFDKRHLLNRHEKQHTKPVQCPVPGCSHSTAKRRDMQRHIIVHHPNDDAAEPSMVMRQFMCPVAGCKHAEAGFKRKDHLVRHMKRIHPGMSP